MHAHSNDLRAEIGDLPAEEREALISALQAGWRAIRLEPEDAALCLFAEKLTHAPGAMRAEDVEALRAAGFDDVAIHDAIQVVSYFNYINRIADAVHVALEPEMPPDPRG